MMMIYYKSFSLLLCHALLATRLVQAFTPSSLSSLHNHNKNYASSPRLLDKRVMHAFHSANDKEQMPLDVSVFAPPRRKFLQSTATKASLMWLLLSPEVSNASGGATAGGAYLLSAKQRYNSRVTAGVKGYVALNSGESFDVEAAKVYFSSEEVGSWQDFQSAGYLLANAFRRSSSTAPDSLPAVKKWKAFKAVAEELEKKVTKKKGNGAAEVFEKSRTLLDDYLGEIELPSADEL